MPVIFSGAAPANIEANDAIFIVEAGHFLYVLSANTNADRSHIPITIGINACLILSPGKKFGVVPLTAETLPKIQDFFAAKGAIVKDVDGDGIGIRRGEGILSFIPNELLAAITPATQPNKNTLRAS